jgi:hypothetical protein
MLRRIEASTPPSDAGSNGQERAATPPVGAGSVFSPSTLEKLGLGQLARRSTDPRQLALQLQADDESDGKLYLDEFSRGIRRAVRLQLAFEAQLYRHSGQTWKEWVAGKFHAGYECYQRYRLAAEIQAGLIERGLPMLVNEAQARALVPFRKHAKFWDVLKEKFSGGFPTGSELRKEIRQALQVKPVAVARTPRLSLHRSLSRLLEATPKNEDDPSVVEALALMRRAILLLEKGNS